MQIIKKIFVLGVNLCKNNLSEGYIANLITVLFFLFVCLFVNKMLLNAGSSQNTARGCASCKFIDRLGAIEEKPSALGGKSWQNTLSGAIHSQPHYCLGGLHIKMLLIWGVLLLSGIAIITPEMQTPHYFVKQTVFIFGPFSTWTVQN